MARFVLVAAFLLAFGGGAPSAASVSAKPPERGKPAPRAPKPPHGNAPAWILQTNSACKDARRAREATLRAVGKKPARSVRLTLLRLLAGTLRVDRSLLARLSEVKPPQGESRLVVALDLFRARVAEDADLLARLRRRWSATALDRQTLRDDAANTRLTAFWSDAGSRDCAAYFRAGRGRVYGLTAASSGS